MQCIDIIQDSKGYIWIATKGGLSRFDGIKFKNYGKAEGVKEANIKEIKEDSKGNIWFLTNSGVSLVKNDTILYFKNKGYYFNKFFIDKQDNLWIFSYSNKLIKFSNGKFHLVYNDNKKWNCSYNKKKDYIYISTAISESDSFLSYVIKNNKIHYEGKSDIYKFYFDDFLLETKYQNGIVVSKKFFDISGKDKKELTVTNKKINSFVKIDNTTYAFAVEENDNLSTIWLFKNKKLSLLTNMGYYPKLLIDSEKNIWAATENGLYKITFFKNYTKKDGMPNYVWSVQEDSYGKIWFASYYKKRLYFLTGNKIKAHPKIFSKPFFYMGAIRTQNGDILFPHIPVIKYDGKKFSELKKIYQNTSILSIFEDTYEKKILFGSVLGLQIKDNKGNVVLNKRFINAKDGIILSMKKNNKGELWYVSRKSFGILNRKDTLVMHNDTLSGAMSLYCDYKGNLWIGGNNGLYFYDYKKIRFIFYPELKTMIGSVTEVDSTHIVYGGLRGIGILDLNKFYSLLSSKKDLSLSYDLYIDYYTQSNGFMGEEVGQNGIFKDSKGRIWVPANNNVVMFRFEDLRKNKKPPYLYINNIQISEDNINWTDLPDTVEYLKHTQSNVRFEFIGICYTEPELVKFKYRLRGFNNAWSNETKKPYVSFTNLQPGNYTFELLSCNNSGVWNKIPVQRKFTVKAAWWQSVFFKISSFIFSVMFILIVILLIQRRIGKKKEMENKLNNLQMKNSQSQIYPHLLFNAISAVGSVIYKEEREKAYDYLVKMSQLMRKSLTDTKRLYKSIREELDFVENYLQIQKIRFPDRFDYLITVANDVDITVTVPQMIIQTYVENSVKYGVEPMKKGGLLKINIKMFEKGIRITIEDNGIGLEASKKNSYKGTGSGIKIMNEIYHIHNLQKKNKISFQMIDLYKKGGKGTKVIVEIELNT